LTVHKTQSLSLDDITLCLDASFFSVGQAYTALSRGTHLNGVQITHLDKDAFLVDQEAVSECERLQNIWNKYQTSVTNLRS